MKYVKAEAKVVLFDNSDVITTSPGDLAPGDCNSPYEGSIIKVCTWPGENSGSSSCPMLIGTFSND